MSSEPMRIKLSDDRRLRMITSIQSFISEKWDMDISEFQTTQLLDFFVKELGAPVYNQAIRDAHAFIEEKLNDLSSEFYESEE